MTHNALILDPAQLTAAQTFFASGQYPQAIAELDRLDPAWHSHPDVLEMRFHIGAIIDNWELSCQAAMKLVEIAPERPSAWIQRATALHRLNRTEEAILLLEPAVKMFSGEWHIPYHLARLNCLLGYWEKTWTWLVIALGTGDPKKVRTMVFNDPDLKPFWTQISKDG